MQNWHRALDQPIYLPEEITHPQEWESVRELFRCQFTRLLCMRKGPRPILRSLQI